VWYPADPRRRFVRLISWRTFTLQPQEDPDEKAENLCGVLLTRAMA
jgi:hypothetical protein